MAVKEQGNGEELGRIEAIGRRLNDAYCDEVGAVRAAIGQPAVTQTPLDFRSELVTITAVELGEMRSGSQGEKMGDRGNQKETVVEQVQE